MYFTRVIFTEQYWVNHAARHTQNACIITGNIFFFLFLKLMTQERHFLFGARETRACRIAYDLRDISATTEIRFDG